MSETGFLIPVAILLGTSVLLSALISILKIKIIPNFVLEIIIGIVLGVVLKDYLADQKFTTITDGLYVVGFALIMFLSGFDADLDIIKDKEHTSAHHINIVRISTALLIAVYALSLIASLFFINNYNNRLLGIILLTITFSSTFAGVVAPLVAVDRLNRTGWGNMMITFAFLSELLSIVLLTVYMIVTEASLSSLWGFLLIIGVFVALFFGLKLRQGRKIEAGTVFLKTRMILLALALSVILSEYAGGEYVLGAFLLGFFLKAIGLDEHNVHLFKNIGYGLFIPMFFILVGMQIDIIHFIKHPNLLLLVLLLFICFIVVKVPLLYLLKWYKPKTAITAVILSSCTLVVAITASHIGHHLELFSADFGEALILASILTAIVAPIIYEVNFPKTIKLIRLNEKGITYGRTREIIKK